MFERIRYEIVGLKTYLSYELRELKKDIIFYCDKEPVDIDSLPSLGKTDIYIPPLYDINNDNIIIHYNMEA